MPAHPSDRRRRPATAAPGADAHRPRQRSTTGSPVSTTGADDYLVKPFAFAELAARVRIAAAPRRRPHRRRCCEVGDLELDTARHEARRGDRPLDLTAKEFALLRYFMAHAGEVLSQEDLLEHVWDEHADPFTNTVRVTVGTLRRKLAAGGEAQLIETVIGRGYRLRRTEPVTRSRTPTDRRRPAADRGRPPAGRSARPAACPTWMGSIRFRLTVALLRCSCSAWPRSSSAASTSAVAPSLDDEPVSQDVDVTRSCARPTARSIARRPCAAEFRSFEQRGQRAGARRAPAQLLVRWPSVVLFLASLGVGLGRRRPGAAPDRPHHRRRPGHPGHRPVAPHRPRRAPTTS